MRILHDRASEGGDERLDAAAYQDRSDQVILK